MWLIDAYRSNDKIVLWYKYGTRNIRKEQPYTMSLYAEPQAESFLKKNNIAFEQVTRKTYSRKQRKVLHIPFKNISSYERFVRYLETETHHRVALYNADIKPEQMYLYEHNLTPFDSGDVQIPLSTLHCTLVTNKDIKTHDDATITYIHCNDRSFFGKENDMLTSFASYFASKDPDIISMPKAFSHLPFLAEKMAQYNVTCPFHRWDPTPIKYRGGKSFFTYGTVRYRDYGVRLHGRLLVEDTSFMGDGVEIESLIELCQLSGTCLQQTASRSYGAVFQSALVREIVRDQCLVPYKYKPIDQTLSLLELLKTDRVGHIYDAEIGFHKNVAEIDFSSMYPWLMHNHNISAEAILSPKSPFEIVPGTPIRISHHYKGYVSRAIYPFIERRMYYKNNPSEINRIKAAGLKWVLVSSYGYLRYREFKLGIPTAHMATGAYAREILVASAKIAEQMGFHIVHGVADALYVTKPKMQQEDVKKLCDAIESYSNIPLHLEGIYKWVCFMPSINNIKRAMPIRYFGVFDNGSLKVRGLDVRQQNTPLLIKQFQQYVLEDLATYSTPQEFRSRLPHYCSMIRSICEKISHSPVEHLASKVRISKITYKNNIAQRRIVTLLQQKGEEVLPGHFIRFYMSKKGAQLLENYNQDPDVAYYKKKLIRSLYIIFQSFDISREHITILCEKERQLTLAEFAHIVRYSYIPMHIRGKRRGLAERKIRHLLTKQGWEVWRGSLYTIPKRLQEYPNVTKKYQRLYALLDQYHPGIREELSYLSRVHHGLPDFICFRRGEFRFVECKFEYEQLSDRQKKCIPKLQRLGIAVEVHTLVSHKVRQRSAVVNLSTQDKIVHEKQRALVLHW